MSRLIPMPMLSPVELDAASYAVEDAEGAVYIPVIATKNPGTGEGGAFLDSLPTDKTIKVPGVMSEGLRGMLERRGYTPRQEWGGPHYGFVEVFVREAEGRQSPIGARGRPSGATKPPG